MSAYASGDDLVLASLDVLGDDGELRERARAELRATTPDTGPADGRAAIRVTVNDRGLVEDVTVDRNWRDHVAPEAFADTLFRAYAAALAPLVNAPALRAFAAYEQGDRRPSPDTRATASTPPPADPRVWLASVWNTLRDLDDTLHRLERGQPDDTQLRTVTDPQGHLTATCRDGQVTAVTGDARRIGAADAQRLRTAALAVFRAAQRGDQT